MGINRTFNQINTADRDLQLIQANIEKAISPFIKAELLNGRLISGLVLAIGSNSVEHKLNRVPAGFLLADTNAAINLYTVSKDSNFLFINSSGAATVSIWVF